MKTQFLSAVLISVAILTGSFAYSQDAKEVNTFTKKIIIKSPFQKITVGSNMMLVLVQAENNQNVVITGEANLVQYVNVGISNGVLSIRSDKNLKNKKIRIYVPVTTLSSVDLASYSSVTSEGIVKLEGLNVLVHEGSKVALNVLGDFHVEASDDCDFVYEKHEIAKVIYIKN